MNEKTKLGRLSITLLVVGCLLTMFSAPPARAGDDVVVLKAGVVHVGDGRAIEHAVVVVGDGRIAAVGPDVTVPQGARVIEVAEGSITPGLVEANAWVDPTDLLAPPPADAYTILNRFLHHHDPGHRDMTCCGSRCPRAYLHEAGKKCPICGWPDTAPRMAVGTNVGRVAVEQSSEVVPETRVLDGLNLRSPDFGRLARGGVTTAFVAPDTAAVIGARGAIVRTAGPMSQRVIREADAVQAVMGSDAFRRGQNNNLPMRHFVTFNTRRPVSRMGVDWVFRKAMYDAQRTAKGLPVSGADTPSPAALAALREILSGAVPVRMHARTQNDILSAFRLSREFGLPFTLVEGTEAYRCLDELVSGHVPVVFGPVYVDAPGYRAYTGETDRNRVNTFKVLLDAGVTTALSAYELRDEDGLARQALYAMRSGLTLEQVLPAVTATPAKLLGLGDELGTVESGKRADLIVWNGEPFAATSTPEVVMIGGEVVVDRRHG